MERSAPEEVVSLRDDHTQVFEVRKKLEVTDPVTGQVTITEGSSRYVVKGQGLCYRSGNQWLPSNPHWVTGATGFAAVEAIYSLSCGHFLSSGVVLHRDGADITLRPAGIEVVGAGSQKEVLLPVGDVQGTKKEGDDSCLVFPGAFGSGIDLCYRLTPAGVHQEIIFARKPALPEGAAPAETEVMILTEIDFGGIDLSKLKVEAGTEKLSLGSGAQSTSSVKVEPVNIFFEENSESILCFLKSKVTDSRQAKQRLDFARRSFVCEPDGNCYLIERLSYAFFEDAQLPVVWDYQEVSGSIITEDEVWEAGITYWVQGAIAFEGGTLRIEGGATVKFNPDAGPIYLTNGGVIVADGEVIAQGESYPYVGYRNVAYHYIVFTSADDNNCGEDLPSPPSGYPDQYLVISGSGSSNSRVRFCKFARAYGCEGMLYVGDELGAPIEHNVFLLNVPIVPGYYELQCSLYCNSYGTCFSTDIRNNLFVFDSMQDNYYQSAIYFEIHDWGYTLSDIANNTFVDYSCYSSYPIYYSAYENSAFGTWTGNIFSNCYYPTNAYYVDGATRNAYYQTYPIDGESSYYDWGWDPNGYPFVEAATGLFYLRLNKESYKSSETAGQAGLYDEAGTFTVRAPSNYEGTSPIVGGRLYDNDSEMAIVGYHALRVDTNVYESRYLGEVTINQGATVSFSGPGQFIGITGGTGNVTCQGDENRGWVHLLDSRVVSNVVYDSLGNKIIESPPPQNGDVRGQLRILDGSQQKINIEKTRFLSMGAPAVLVSDSCSSATVTIKSSEFWGCNKGIETSGDTLTIHNTLFYRNGTGCDNKSVGTTKSVVTNCTFDSNGTGLHSTQGSIVVRNCIFNNNQPALHFEAAGWQEDHNGFYKNYPGQGIIDENGIAVAINERSYPLAALPYDRSDIERSVWWIKGRDSLMKPAVSEIVLEDAGSGPPTDFGLETESSNRYGIRDSGPLVEAGNNDRLGVVDVGYHPIMFFESQDPPDTLPDRWEVHYFGGTAGPSDNDDGDNDGLVNKQEYEQGTAPTAEDTDGDAWYDTNADLWYGRDKKEEGEQNYRGDGMQDYGFVEGPCRFDPRRPPYLQNMTLNSETNKYSVSIYWGFDIQDDPMEHSWKDGESSSRLWIRKSSESTFVSYGAVDAPDPDPDLKLLKYRLSGLDPDSLYFYKIEFKENVSAEPRLTPAYAFRTWGLNPSSFSFAVYGDTRGKRKDPPEYNDNHQVVMDRLLADSEFLDLDFLVCVGDFVYEGGDCKYWNPHFFYPAAKVLRHLPLIAVAGNHEYNGDDDLKNFRAFFEYEGEPAGYDEWDFNFEYGEAHFFIADTRKTGPSDDSINRLFDGLNQSTKKWEFVFFHIPGYAHADGHDYCSSVAIHVRDAFFDRSGDYLDNTNLGVTGIFCGHVHLYERALIGYDLPLEPLNQLVLGGGGAPLSQGENLPGGGPNYPEGCSEPQGWSKAKRAYQQEAYNYCVVKVTSTQVSFRVMTKKKTDESFTQGELIITERHKL